MLRRLAACWFPALYSTKKYKPAQPPAYSYSSKEIKRLSLYLQELYDQLAGFAGDLEAQNRAWSLQLKQPPDPPPTKKDQTP